MFSSDGWGWFLLSTAAQVYLVLVLSLAAIATVPMVFGWQGSVVQSGSMEPHISPGDVVLSTGLPEDVPVPVGRVVEFERPTVNGPGTTTVLHRIVSDNGDGTYVTAGDANADVDSTPITRDQITAQGRLLIPFVGLPGLWTDTANFPPLAIWAVLTLLAITAAGYGLAPLKRPHDEDQAEEPDKHIPDAAEPVPAGPPGTVARRTILVLAIGSVAAALTALPRGTTTAAFTGRTSTVNNSWGVRTLPPLTLGRASPYGLFAANSIINNGGFFDFSTYIDGSAGTSPGTTVVGFYSFQISGSVDRNNQVARNAKTDVAALYTAIDARTPTATLNPTLTGPIGPGVYTSTTGTFNISNTLTLDGRGDSSAVFIFTAATITAARNSYINLINGAAANNVYVKADTIALARDSVTSGNFLATGNAAAERNADLTGRLISLNGNVTINRTTTRLPR